MPLELDMDERRYEDFKAEFADRIIETWARYCPNMTKRRTSSAATSIPAANMRAS